MSKESEKEDTKEIKPVITSHGMSPFEEMDNMIDNLFHRGWMQPLRWEMPSLADFGTNLDMKMLRVDVIDRENEVLVRAEAPGVKKEDLEISINDHSVTIKGKTSHEEKEEKGNYYRSEISRGVFSRTIALPRHVDTDKAKASFKDGVLEMTIPKIEKSKRKSVKVE